MVAAGLDATSVRSLSSPLLLGLGCLVRFLAPRLALLVPAGPFSEKGEENLITLVLVCFVQVIMGFVLERHCVMICQTTQPIQYSVLRN